MLWSKELTLLIDAIPGRWVEKTLGSRFAHVEALVTYDLTIERAYRTA